MLYITPLRKNFSQSWVEAVLDEHLQRFQRIVSWSVQMGHQMSGLIYRLVIGPSTMGLSDAMYLQLTTSRKRSKGTKILMMNWKKWYQIQQIYGTIFLRSSSRFSFSSVWKNYSTYLQAKEPLNSMALLIVVQMMKIHTAKQTVLIKKTKCQSRNPVIQGCEKNWRASMKPRQKLSLLIIFFDYYFNRFYWSFTSRYCPPSLLTAAIVGSSSSQEVYFKVFAYQLPNLMTEGIIAMIMKKLITKITMSMVLCVKKLIYLLKMMERCLEQSETTTCRCLLKTPSESPNAKKNRQKSRLMPSAMMKQFFRPQFVMKKVSMPNLTVQMKMSAVVQKGKTESCAYIKLMRILMAKKSVSPRMVVITLENSLAKGYFSTCSYQILMTDTSCSTFSFFFLGLTYALMSGGRKRAAPLGKKRKLGYLDLAQCRPMKREISKTASNIMLNNTNKYKIANIQPKVFWPKGMNKI